MGWIHEIYKIKQETLKLKVWFKIRIAGEFDINKLQLLRKKNGVNITR